MKKLLLLLLCFTLSVGVMAACGGCGTTPTESSVPDAQTYTVTFVQDGVENVVKTVSAGQALTDIPTPVQKTGYTVDWAAEDVAKLASVGENLTVTAVATANKYVITYVGGEGASVSLNSQEVTFNTAPGAFATATREGYEFLGWKNGDAIVTADTVWNIAENVTLTAAWRKLDTYTITFKQDGQVDRVEEVTEGGSFTVNFAPAAKTGYTVEWNRDDIAKLNNITGNLTVGVTETAKKYVVRYDGGDGATVSAETQEMTYDVAPGTLATATRDGYTFSGWLYDGKAVTKDALWNIDAENIVLVADWEPIEKCVVTFSQSGEDPVKVEVLPGESVAEADIPAIVDKTGYTKKWLETDLAKLNNVSESFIIVAFEEANKYVITYDAGAEATPSDKTQTVTFDAIPGSFATVSEREGYIFNGWKYDGKTVTADTIWKIAQDVTLTADWQKKAEYTITFVQDGQEPKTRTVYAGETLTDIPEPVAVKGHNVSWDRTDFTNITQNITVNAKIEAKTYTVTFDAAGGSVSSASTTVKYGEKPTLPTPTRSGYTFLNWQYNGVAITGNENWSIDEADGTVKLVATWQKNKVEEDEEIWVGPY